MNIFFVSSSLCFFFVFIVHNDCFPPYPAGDSRVSQCFAHQVAQQCVGSQETQADVGSFGEFPQHGRVGKIHGSRTPINQRHHNLCVKGRGHRGR